MTESKRAVRLKTRVRSRLPTPGYAALVLIGRATGENLDTVINRAAAAYVAAAKQSGRVEQ